MSEYRTIYCAGCGKDTNANLTSGLEIYPHRPDLHKLPFWKCRQCGNYVGCHHKDKNNPTLPLGIIPTKELRDARQHIHQLIDPLHESGKISRGRLYSKLTKRLGWKYHTANIRSVEEARRVYKTALEIKRELMQEAGQ